MKHIIGIALIIALTSCNGNSNSTTETSSDSSSGRTEIGGVENVNGNIPDTTSMGATPLSGNNAKPIDSSYADTVNKVR